MSESLSPRYLMRSLSIGNVVSAGVQLYRSRLRLYLSLALRACLWFLVPVYGWAKFLAIFALISRLTFGDLIGQPETVEDARHYTHSRMWRFLVTSILVNVRLFLSTLGLAILTFLIWGILGLIFQNLLSAPNPPASTTLLMVGLFLTSILVFFVLVGRIYSRFFIVELPLAVENNVNDRTTITRSLSLTKGFVTIIRIQGVFLLGFLITFPIQALLQLLSGISGLILNKIIEDAVLYSNISRSLSFGLVLLNITLFIPFWQALKAVLYYDLRSRREGFGLQLQRLAGEEKLTNALHVFNRVTLETPENVELEFSLGGIGNRASALLIDYLVLILTLTAFVVVWLTVSTQLVDFWEQFYGSSKIGLWLLAIGLLIIFLIYTGYFVLFETLWQGQTPGKRFAKIRVICDDGRPVGLQQATLRALLRPFDDILFVGAFLIMLGRREKRLGDWAAGTLVIQAESSVRVNFAISKQAQPLAEQLPKLAELTALLPDDFAVIREYLQRRQVMAPQARSELSLQLAKQVKAIITLAQLPTAVTPDVFLEAVYLAYQQREF